MKYELKKQIYNFLCSINDNSKECVELIKKMETEINYADVDAFSISIEDLEYTNREARKALGKDENEPFTMDDCARVAEAMGNLIEDEFSENLYNTFEYEM